MRAKRLPFKFSVDPAFVLLGLVLVFTGNSLMFLSYLATILMHEISHSSMANMLGYRLDTICLMPYGAKITGALNVKYTDEILIAIAGPLFNIAVVVVLTALWWLYPPLYLYTETLVIANFVTAVFNFFPVYPLDGGRVLFALLGSRIPARKAARCMKIISITAAVIFSALFLLSLLYNVNINLIIIAVFCLLSAVTTRGDEEYARIRKRSYRNEWLKGGLPVREILAETGTTPLQLLKRFRPGYYYRVTIVDKNFVPLRTLTETEIEDLSERAALEPISVHRKEGV